MQSVKHLMLGLCTVLYDIYVQFVYSVIYHTTLKHTYTLHRSTCQPVNNEYFACLLALADGY